MSEPPRKRPRSAMSPEERKEARAHRNRIAAQNSRDRRKVHFANLERRVAELEEENRRLRAGLPVGPPSCAAISEPEVVTIEHEREEKRKQTEEQRERENEQLRERIRSLEIGYQTVLRALADQGKFLPSMHTPTSPSSSHLPLTPSSPSSSRLPPSPTPAEDSSPSATSLRHSAPSSPGLTFPLSPAPTHSTLADSPLTLAPDSLDLPFTPAFSSLSSNSPLLDSPKHSFDLTLSSDAPTRHLARVATTPGFPAVALQRVGSARAEMRSRRPAKGTPVVRSRLAFYLGLRAFFVDTRFHSRTRTRPRTTSLRVCSRRLSRLPPVALALFRVIALRQKRHSPRRR